MIWLLAVLLVLFTLARSLQRRFRKTNTIRRVLIIGCDGVRADCLNEERAPNMLSLKPKTAPVQNARTSFLTISAPGWTSCLTGQWPYRHKAFENEFENYERKQHPSIFDRAEQEGIKHYVVSAWDGITKHLARGLWTNDNDDTALTLLTGKIREMSTSRPDAAPQLLFIHLDAVDHAGHEFGFAPEQKEYTDAIAATDVRVGRILAAVDAHLSQCASNRPEDWLILLTTDHGGGVEFRDDHGDDAPAVRNIFVYAQHRVSAGPGRRRAAGKAGAPAVPLITRTERFLPSTTEIVDVAVLAMTHLRFACLPGLIKAGELDGTLELKGHKDKDDYHVWWREPGYYDEVADEDAVSSAEATAEAKAQ